MKKITAIMSAAICLASMSLFAATTTPATSTNSQAGKGEVVQTTASVRACFVPGISYPNAKKVPDVNGANLGFITFGSKGEVQGLDFGLLGSLTDNVNGGEVGLIFSKTENMNGFQFSCLNMDQKANGATVGLIYNRAKNVENAFQIGLINDSDHTQKGFQIGLINIMDNGFFKVFPFFNCPKGSLF